MKLSVTCDCGRSYRVSEQHAGKRFQCKTCGAKVSVPRPGGGSRKPNRAATDHFDDFGETAAVQRDDYDYEDYDGPGDEFSDDYGYAEPRVRQPRRNRPAKRKNRRKRRRSDGMPVSVIVAIIGEGLLIPMNLLEILGNLTSANSGAYTSGVIFGCLFRIALEVAIIVGLFQRQNQARVVSIVLSCLALVLLGVGTIGAMIGVPQPGLEGEGEVVRGLVIVLLLGRMAITGTIAGALLMPSAREFCDS